MAHLRFLTQNVKMLPGPGKEHRAQKICDAVLGIREPSLDVLCFQEVFDEDVRDVLSLRLRDRFPCRVEKLDDGDLFHEDSGLFFASVHPILDVWYEEFDDAAGWDNLADKGVSGARLDLSALEPGTEAFVFQVHLQSDPDDVGEHRDVRRSQLRQVMRFVQRRLEDVAPGDLPIVLLMGDFNVHGRVPSLPRDEVREMKRSLQRPRDLFREAHPAEPGFTWDAATNKNMIPANDGDQLRLDYALAYDLVHVLIDGERVRVPCRSVTLRSAKLERFATTPTTRLSDHYGLNVLIDF